MLSKIPQTQRRVYEKGNITVARSGDRGSRIHP